MPQENQMASRRIAVLGGGHGAHAHAADLALAGHDVRLFELPAFAGSVAAARSMGGIELVERVGEMRGTSAAAGGRTGFAPVGMVTTDIGQAVRGAEVILVVVPAYAQRTFMDAVIPVLEDGQIVVFEPGQFASLEFRRLLAESSSPRKIIVGETVSMLYSARLQSPGRVWIKAYKENFSFAALPRTDTPAALAVIRDFYPQFVAAHSVMETSIYRPGAVIHPISTLLNVVKIEQMGPYRYAYYDVTPSVARVMEAVDAERVEIASLFGAPRVPLGEWQRRFYGADAKDIYTAIRTTPPYSRQTSPDSMRFRYVSEDVPYMLVPIAALGRLAGASTRACDMIIDLACCVNGEDYRQQGRGLARMGLEGASVTDIRRKAEA